jgi:hypothetical protein
MRSWKESSHYDAERSVLHERACGPVWFCLERQPAGPLEVEETLGAPQNPPPIRSKCLLVIDSCAHCSMGQVRSDSGASGSVIRNCLSLA